MQRTRGNAISNLGGCYLHLGYPHKAINFLEQGLSHQRKARDRKNESITLLNIGRSLLDLGEHQSAIENLRKSIEIADEVSYLSVQSGSRILLSQVFLFRNDLINAYTILEESLKYVWEEYGRPTDLMGIIMIRQGKLGAARKAFEGALAQVEELLAQSSEIYDTLDTKGLALSGLVLCSKNGMSSSERAKMIDEAIQSFSAARQIAPYPGIVNHNLRLFDELAKCDPEGWLAGVREAVEGKGNQ